MALFFVHSGVVYGQEPAKAAPAVEVEAQLLPTRGDRPVVVELFSTQACVFCPGADRLFVDLIQQEGVIGLACHVDYFDVGQGSLAQEFCTERQTNYMRSLSAGPNYTPQIVVDGSRDVVGYKTGDVVSAIKHAEGVETIKVTPQKGNTFKVDFPKLESEKPLNVWMAVYDFPHDLIVADGNNKGQHMTYYNVISRLEDLGPLRAEETSRTLAPDFRSFNAGFAVLVQQKGGGEILAAGQFQRKKAEEIFAPPPKE